MSDKTTEPCRKPWKYDAGQCNWPACGCDDGRQIAFPSWWHHDPVEILAVAMEESFFAPHEYPIGRARHEKFRQAARAAIGVLRDE